VIAPSDRTTKSLPYTCGEVRVWIADVDAAASDENDRVLYLDDDKRRRLMAFRTEMLRDRFLSRRWFLQRSPLDLELNASSADFDDRSIEFDIDSDSRSGLADGDHGEISL
jgi:hypothetical protein